jgi:heme-degrading monooxygenase HmoA
MFIAMNRFRVAEGQEGEFERRWRERETYLAGVIGFREFALLRGDEPGEYISHSTWDSREAFTSWTRSDAFVAAHRQGSAAGLLREPPRVSLYDVVLSEGAPQPAATI